MMDILLTLFSCITTYIFLANFQSVTVCTKRNKQVIVVVNVFLKAEKIFMPYAVNEED